MATTKERMIRAKHLIEAQRYDEARAILITIDHPTADKWLEKLNRYSKKNELTYEPVISKVAHYIPEPTPVYISPMKDYTNAAMFVMVLYFVLYIPGLIANVVYWNQAQNDAKRYGSTPQGAGCLNWLLIVFFILPFTLGLCAIFG